MRERASVVIGVPLYNGEGHVVEAIESLLSQTYADFELVLVDDASTDATADLVAPYADADPRVHLHRNADRLGLVGNWQRAFELARELRPNLDYFAWGSDHDVWHPRWLEFVVGELDGDPDAVAAYPRMALVEGSTTLLHEAPPFSTLGVEEPRERAERTWRAGAFGSRVYALFRAAALERCRVYRPVYMPDRLLLTELALYGPFIEVPQILWYKRRTGTTSRQRQRAAFFPGHVPLRFRLPWRYAHSWTLLWSLGVRGRGRPFVSRRGGARFSARYWRLARKLRPEQS